MGMRWRAGIARLILLMVAGVLAGDAGLVDAQGGPSGGTPWDLKQLPQPGILVFYDTPAGSSDTGKPLDIGDFDANGCGDVAVTGQNASHAVNGTWRLGGGHVRVLMNVCEIGGRVALEDGLDQVDYPLVNLYGALSGDMAGTEIYVADFNGDGYSDLVLGAQNHDGPNQSRVNTGAVYILLGGPEFASRGDVDLLQPADDVLVFLGATEGDHFGIWVEGGDFDGDGLEDVLIGAALADGEQDARINAGEAWIIYGAPDLRGTYGSVVDMRNPPADATRIIGVDYDDLFGSTVYGSDLNGDGIAEAIVSAAVWRGSAGVGGLSFGGGDGPGNDRYNAGETYILFGDASLRGQTVDLAAMIDEDGAPVDGRLTVIYGPDPNDMMGEELATGDVNGDGFNDLIVGSLVTDGPDNQLSEAGEAWVIFTDAAFAGRVIDLQEPPGGAVVIYPDQPKSKGGDTVRVADIDADGYGDVLYGAPDYDPTGYDGLVRPNAGMLIVLYGGPGGLAHQDGRIVLPSQEQAGMRVSYVIGADTNDMMAYALAAYDVDGDGYADLAPNGMGGDGAYNTEINAGEFYLISGAEFAFATHAFGTGEREAAAGPTVQPAAPTATPLPFEIDTSMPGDVDQGRRLYRQACAGCHGLAADGEGVGLPLVGSPFVVGSTNEALLLFLRVGRTSDDPVNVTGVTMPAYGGRDDWGDSELWDVVAYLRYMNEPR